MMLCSSGGGRSDRGALKYFTEYWCSDDTDPIERLFIQWGFSYFMPAKAMCSHVTAWNKQASVKFRTDVSFPCKLGFDIDLGKLSDADRALVFAYDLHPRFREHIAVTRLQGLDRQARYHVREILCTDPKKPFVDHTYTGEYLMTVGLRLLTDKDMTSRIMEITKE